MITTPSPVTELSTIHTHRISTDGDVQTTVGEVKKSRPLSGICISIYIYYIYIICRCIPIRQNIVLLLGYFATEINGLCSDTEDTPVNDLETCKKAVDQIKKTFPSTYFKNRVNRANWGCYLYINNGSYFMNFNRHATGSTNRKSRQICFLRDEEQYYSLIQFIYC